MKLNWGHGIMIFTALFMVFILSLVYRCSKQNIDLVATNYYEQELKYDEQMLKEKNSSELKEDLKMNYDEAQQAITIQYPTSASKLTGEIAFIKPDGAQFDFIAQVTPDNSFAQIISSAKMKKGKWNVKVNWKIAEKDYFHQQTIFIN
jgi:hypothetical protein